MTQLVPSLWSMAHLVVPAASIAVVAAPPAWGTTLLADETTVPVALVFLIHSMRPGYVAADCIVNVLAPAFVKINVLSVVSIVRLTADVTGDDVPKAKGCVVAPVANETWIDGVVPAPTELL